MNRINITIIDLCIILSGAWFGIQFYLNSQPFGLSITLFLLCYLSARLRPGRAGEKKLLPVLFFLLFFCSTFFATTNTFAPQLNFLLFTNSSILGLQLALFAILLYWIVQQSAKPALFLYITLLSIVILATLLTGSRGAVIALLAGCMFLNPQWRKLSNRLNFKPVLMSVFFVIIIVALFALTFKSDSTSGRAYIVENSITLFSNNMFTGVGAGGFNPAYNHTQAAYFSTHSLTDKRALLANDGYFAFNEVLHTGVEQGIVGLIVLGILLLIVCRETYTINNRYSDKRLEVAILISITVNSMISYPLHNLLVLGVFAYCLGSLSQRAQPFLNIKVYWLKIVWFFSIFFTAYFGYHRYMSEIIIEDALSLKNDGYKMDALKKLSDEKSLLISNVNFGMLYLDLLYDTGNERTAINDFEMVHKYHCNQKMHKIIAKSYREVNDLESAEKHFLLSLQITPQLLQSRLDLANFYKTTGNDSLSRYWAAETITSPVKVYSSRVEQIRESARKILQQLSQKPSF